MVDWIKPSDLTEAPELFDHDRDCGSSPRAFESAVNELSNVSFDVRSWDPWQPRVEKLSILIDRLENGG